MHEKSGVDLLCTEWKASKLPEGPLFGGDEPREHHSLTPISIAWCSRRWHGTDRLPRPVHVNLSTLLLAFLALSGRRGIFRPAVQESGVSIIYGGFTTSTT